MPLVQAKPHPFVPPRPAMPPKPAAPPPPRPGAAPGAAVVQRRIFWSNMTGQWEVAGRVTGHDSAQNRRALSAKIRMRDAGATNDYRAQNNAHEDALWQQAGNAGDFIRGNLRNNNLAICHKMSSEMVQQNVADAANNGNWATVQAMIDGIDNSGWADILHNNYEQIYDNAVDDHHFRARQLKNGLANGTTNATAANLTMLAGLIANSPANLFIGNQTTNASIQGDGDFNSFERNPVVPNANNTLHRRRLTLDSRTIYNQLGGLPGGTPNGMMPVSHGVGLASGQQTYRHTRATALSGTALGGTYLASSTNANTGYAAL
jgi:hypothetical protein